MNLIKEQKRDQRLRKWLSSPGVTFRSSATERAYKESVTRFTKAFLCTEPDRDPVMMPAGKITIQYSGVNLKSVMYDPTLIRPTRAKFMNAFYDDMDGFFYDS